MANGTATPKVVLRGRFNKKTANGKSRFSTQAGEQYLTAADVEKLGNPSAIKITIEPDTNPDE